MGKIDRKGMGKSHLKKIRLEKNKPNGGDRGILSASLISLQKVQNSLDDPVSSCVRWHSSFVLNLCPPKSPVSSVLYRDTKNTTFKLVHSCHSNGNS